MSIMQLMNREKKKHNLIINTDLLSLDCPAVAMRLEDVMKAKSPQVLVWHCQLWQQKNESKHHHAHLHFDYTDLIHAVCELRNEEVGHKLTR